jgi:hypothetical protein
MLVFVLAVLAGFDDEGGECEGSVVIARLDPIFKN